jgi:hypothetical protein
MPAASAGHDSHHKHLQIAVILHNAFVEMQPQRWKQSENFWIGLAFLKLLYREQVMQK